MKHLGREIWLNSLIVVKCYSLLSHSFLFSRSFYHHYHHHHHYHYHPIKKTLHHKCPTIILKQELTSSIASKEEQCHDFVLAKTRESFKLSELYFLEAKLESKARNWTMPELKGMDANTGSYLLQLDTNIAMSRTHSNNDGSVFHDPSCMNRYDWITKKILAIGTSGKDLIENVITRLDNDRSLTDDLKDFTLDYICFGVMKEKDFFSKNLICRIGQCIPAPAALSSKVARAKLVLIETPTKIYLAQRIDLQQQLSKENSNVMKRWPNRPYQYSSAINPTIALIVVDILYDLTSIRLGEKSFVDMSMLDATCGSGTFLACALDKGMTVVGNDIKDKCVDGTKRNLNYLFESNEFLMNKWKVENQDFSSIENYGNDTAKYHCAVTNLPWGQNTKIMNDRDNRRIMKRVNHELQDGSYCAVISKTDVTDDLTSVGFRIIGMASVPPPSFVLPSSKKSQKKTSQKHLESSNCVISIVTKTPH